MSIAMKVGARLGGMETRPLYSTRPSAQPRAVTPSMLNRMAPNTLRWLSTAISRKHTAARIALGSPNEPMVSSVAGLSTTMPAVFKPISPRNKPTPAPMAKRRLMGMLLSSHSRIFDRLMIIKSTPEINTAPRGNLPAVAHFADHGVGEEGVQAHAGCQANRPVGIQSPSGSSPGAAPMHVATKAAPWSTPAEAMMLGLTKMM